MTIGRAQRFEERTARVTAVFGNDMGTVQAVADVLELMEMAWHDCYGEVSPSEEIIDNVLVCSGGTLGGLNTAARLAVVDRRDLALWASDVSNR